MIVIFRYHSIFLYRFSMYLAIIGKYHYLLYFLALAIQPRMLVTFDESLRPLPVPVRVGQVRTEFKIKMQKIILFALGG